MRQPNFSPGANDSGFNPTDGGNNTGAGFNSDVRASVLVTGGKAVIGGNFTTYNSSTPNRICRLNTDGTIDSTFNFGTGFNGSVEALVVQSDGKVIAGGAFTTYNGAAANRICRLNTDGTLDATFVSGTGFANTVYGLAIQSDGKIIAGGDFISYNGTAINRIARLSSAGAVDGTFSVGTGYNSTVFSIVLQADGKVLVGGAYSTFNGAAAMRLTRLNTTGSIDGTLAIGTGFNNFVYSIALQSDGKIIAAGAYTGYNSVSQNRIVRLSSTGTVDATFSTGSGFDNNCRTVTLQADGKVLAGGDFKLYNGVTNNRMVRINTDGSYDNTYNTVAGFNNTVRCISLQADGKTIVGGFYTSLNNVAMNRIARLDTSGSTDTTFNSKTGFDNSVFALDIQSDGKILSGGFLTIFNNDSRVRIARLNTDGSVDSTFNPGTGFDVVVNAITARSSGKILVGGNFTGYNGTAINRIAQLNSDATLDGTFNVGTGFNNIVNEFEVQPDGKIIVVGWFTSFNGTARNYICRLNSDGSLDASFNASLISAAVTAALQPDGKMIAGGNFTNRIVRLNSDGTTDASFNVGTGFSNIVRIVELLSSGSAVVGGQFTSYNGTAAGRIARLGSNGAIDATFNAGGAGFNGEVWSVKTQSDGKLLVAGDFTTYNGAAANRIIRLNSDGTVDATFVTGTGYNNTARAMALDSSSRVVVGGVYTNYNGVGRNRISRLMLS